MLLGRIEIKGAKTVAAEGHATVLAATSPTGAHSIAEPMKIVPVTSKVSGLGASFARDVAPYSVTVLQLQAR